MRVSSLSDDRVISVVSRHFVPAWLSRDRYQQDKIDPDEKKLVGRIDDSRHEQKLEGGAVCVYIVRPNGDVIATLPVQKASKPDLLLPFLKKVIKDEKIEAKKPDAPAKSTQAEAQAKDKGAVAFVVRTRFDGKENRGTSRDTVELTKKEWSMLLARKGDEVGDSWKVPADVAEKLLLKAYPPVAHWDAKLAKMSSCSLTAKVTKVNDGEYRVRLEGKLELIYPNKGQPTDGTVRAKLVGYLRCEGGELTSLALVSEEAMYVYRWQDKVVEKPMTLSVELP
jgi:hypothetical protein